MAVANFARLNRSAAIAQPHFEQESVEWYRDVNFSWKNITIGIVSNYTSDSYRMGHLVLDRRYPYLGLSKGTPPPSVSVMFALGCTDPGIYRELACGAVFGGAVGMSLTMSGLDVYAQEGLATPSVSRSTFIVFPVDLR